MILMHTLASHCQYAAEQWSKEAARLLTLLQSDVTAPANVAASYKRDLERAIAKEAAYRSAIR